jgi:hypothetical protein
MPIYYKFNDDGILEECAKDACDQMGGFKYLDAKIVSEYSEEKHDKGGWIAAQVSGPSHYAKTDDLGTKGVFNPADGKTYDSRAAYYKAVKAKGLVIAGDDAPTQRATPKTKSVNWEKAVAETLKKTPLKGKTK